VLLLLAFFAWLGSPRPEGMRAAALILAAVLWQAGRGQAAPIVRPTARQFR